MGCVYMASWLELACAEAVGAALKTVQVTGGAHHNEDPKQFKSLIIIRSVPLSSMLSPSQLFMPLGGTQTYLPLDI